MELMKKNIKVFLRMRHVSLMMLVFILFLFGFYIMECYNYTIHGDAFWFLYKEQELVLPLFIFMSVISFEYIHSFQNCNALEAISVNKFGREKYFGAGILTLSFIPLLIFFVAVCFSAIMGVVAGVTSLSFYVHIVSVNFLNYFLVLMLAVVFSSFLAMFFRRISAYSILAFAVFVISPISNMIPGIANDSYGINIWPIKAFFSRVLPPNMEWVMDKQYGLYIELLRWNIVLFWSFLFLALIIWKAFTGNKRAKVVILTAVAILSCMNLYGFWLGGSEVDLSEAPSSVFRADSLYYRHDNTKKQEADFSVKAYDLTLCVKRELQATVKMSLNKNESSEYIFTLYRNYKIESIYTEDNEKLDFVRDGDYFMVLSDIPLSEIYIQYVGHNPLFYTNHQAVLLPGSFPYYPIAGFEPVYQTGINVGPEILNPESYNIIKQENLHDFTLKMEGNTNIYTNIPKSTEKNSYQGKSMSLSIVGGLVEEQQHGKHRVIANVVNDKFGKIDESFLNEVQENLDIITNENPELPTMLLADYTIFQSDTFINLSGYEAVENLGDHIFLMAGWEPEEIAELLMEDIKND